MENTENNEPVKKSFSERLKSAFQIRHIIGLVTGGLSGFLYYYFVGCQSGTCALKSNPFYNIAMGLLLGYLIADMIKIKKK
jgi:uncharacterized membrane protein YesL